MHRTRSGLSLLAVLLAAAVVFGGCGQKAEEPKPAEDKEKPAEVVEDTPGEAPQIAAAETEYDFGKVKQGQDVEHVFKIRNEGKADLLIEKAKGS